MPTRHQALAQDATLAMTPGCSRATTAEPSSAERWSGKVSSFAFDQGATSAVRRPDSRLCRTQPSEPSASRTRRQVSNSAMISTGRPARWIDPAGAMFLGGAFAQVHAVRFQADIARNGQARDGARLHVLSLRGANGAGRRNKSQRENDASHQQDHHSSPRPSYQQARRRPRRRVSCHPPRRHLDNGQCRAITPVLIPDTLRLTAG